MTPFNRLKLFNPFKAIFLFGLPAITCSFLFFKPFLQKISFYDSDFLAVDINKVNIDTNEFAPGFPQTKIPAIDQLKRFPLPRFKVGHNLLPNVLWMSPRYFGGLEQTAISQEKMIQNSTGIMLELAKNWNYYLVLPGNSYGTFKNYVKPNTVAGAYIDLANAHPALPACVIMFWGNLSPKNCGFKSSSPYVFNTSLPGKYYPVGFKRVGPAAPVDSIIQDGLTQKCYLSELLKNLKRPIQLINENGETIKLYSTSELKKDERIIAHKQASGIKDWNQYQSEQRLRIEKAYRDQFMSLPELSNTIFTEYGIDGHSTYRHRYNEIRKINTPINGQYYATPDFYPRWPSNWKNWKGAWHGMKWIYESRVNEINLGDKLFSPFVSAGWNFDEEKNIRPAQWLGLMKCLGMLGAEFYYPGFFNLKPPIPKPENYCWQAAMPVYAQAVTSHLQEFLRKGEVLNAPQFNFSEKENEIVIVRKLNGKKIYAITGTIQPVSNNKNETPLNSNTEINLTGNTYKINVRRQGSTYYLDLTGKNPLIYQLDSWHQYEHPARWKNEYLHEAEIFDPIVTEVKPETENLTGDIFNLTQFTTFIRLQNQQSVAYLLRDNRIERGFLSVRVRSDKKADMEIKSGNAEEKIKIPASKDWTWIHTKTPVLFDQQLSFLLSSGNIEIDKWLISEKIPLKFSDFN